MSRWLVDDVPVFWGGFQPLLTFLSQRKPHGDALQSPAPCTALWGSSQTLGRGDRELRTWPVFPKRGDPSLRLLPLPGLACHFVHSRGLSPGHREAKLQRAVSSGPQDGGHRVTMHATHTPAALAERPFWVIVKCHGLHQHHFT